MYGSRNYIDFLPSIKIHTKRGIYTIHQNDNDYTRKIHQQYAINMQLQIYVKRKAYSKRGQCASVSLLSVALTMAFRMNYGQRPTWLLTLRKLFIIFAATTKANLCKEAYG